MSKKILVDPNKPKEEEAEQVELTASLADDLSYEDMLGKVKEIMRRQIKNLFTEVSKGSLDGNSSRNMIDLGKFLADMSDKEQAAADKLSEEELKAIAQKEKKRERNRKKKEQKKLRDEAKRLSGQEGTQKETGTEPAEG